ncbi:MAG: helix-turn-helix domain-containing protein [Bacilli bacterium]|nr:helix-turn-helix domain-containing protein [Bacilli bacterium]
MNIDLDKIGNFLFEQRNKKGLTQEQLASKIGASFKTVSKWENGGSFPDVSYQLLLCNALDITLKELQMGCLDEEERHKNKCLRIFSRFSIIFIFITIPILCFLLVFFSSHVGKPKIYRIINNSSSSETGKVDGLLVKSYKNNYLMINTINIFNYEKNELDTISMDLYSDNAVLFHSNELDPFIINIDNIYNINYSKLVLSVMIYHNEEIISNEFQLRIKDYLNISSVLNYNSNQNNYYLISTLNKKGFTNVVGDIWYKKINNISSNIDVYFYLNANRIYYKKTADNTTAKLLFYKNYNVLETVIYSNQVFDTIIEKYNYNYSKQELDCKVGLCASYQKALKDIEEYVSLLNGE